MSKDISRTFSIAGRIASMKCAGKGISLTLRSQHNAWIHATATMIVVATGLYLGITLEQWCLIVLACAAVWTAEAMNTAFEFLADATTKEFHPVIAQAKDMAAGAVLITAFGSAIIGILVFGPYFLRLIH